MREAGKATKGWNLPSMFDELPSLTVSSRRRLPLVQYGLSYVNVDEEATRIASAQPSLQ